MSKPDTTPPTADFNASDFPPEAVALIAQLQAREEAYQAELNRSQSELDRCQSEVTRLKNELANLWEQVRLHTHQRWTPSSEKDIPDAQARLFDEAEQLGQLEQENPEAQLDTDTDGAESSVSASKQKKRGGTKPLKNACQNPFTSPCSF